MRVILVTGKGGVGKTTVAAATALRSADFGTSLWQVVVAPDGEHVYVTDRGEDQVVDNVEEADVVIVVVGEEPYAEMFGDRKAEELVLTARHRQALSDTAAGLGRAEALAAGQVIRLGDLEINALATPGHSPGHFCFLCEGRLVTGDILFCGKVGGTGDYFPGSSARQEWDSLQRLLQLPPDTLVLPGHDYYGGEGQMPSSTIGHERAHNPFLGCADLAAFEHDVVDRAFGEAAAHGQARLPAPDDEVLAFYVREAFPSRATGTRYTSGLIDTGHALEIRSENNEGGVIFGDGIEADYLPFNWGMRATFGIARNKLALVQPAAAQIDRPVRVRSAPSRIPATA